MIQTDHCELSIVRQCELLGLARSSFYYEPEPMDPDELAMMNRIDEQYTRAPFFGVPRMVVILKEARYAVGPKRVRRLMARMVTGSVADNVDPKMRHSSRVNFRPSKPRNDQI